MRGQGNKIAGRRAILIARMRWCFDAWSKKQICRLAAPFISPTVFPMRASAARASNLPRQIYTADIEGKLCAIN